MIKITKFHKQIWKHEKNNEKIKKNFNLVNTLIKSMKNLWIYMKFYQTIWLFESHQINDIHGGPNKKDFHEKIVQGNPIQE